MRSVAKNIAAPLNVFKKIEAALSSSIRRYLAARRRRLELEEEFYRKLKQHCLENDIHAVWEDDWRMNR